MGIEAIAEAIDDLRQSGPPRLTILAGRPDRRPSMVGLVAGSFDPMTVAHAALAEALPGDVVLLVYSAATLPKQAGPGGHLEPPLLRPEERVAAMVTFAATRPRIGVALCSHGLLVDQADAAAAAFPGAGLILGMGSDKVLQVFDPAWYPDRDAELDRLFMRAEVAYALRTGDEVRVDGVLESTPRWRGRLRRLDLRPVLASVSARDVRGAIRRGEDVSALVPPEVMPAVRAAASRG